MSGMEDLFTGVQAAEIHQADLEEYAAQAVEKSRRQAAQQRKQRQAEGIAAAKARGVQFGRPRVELPPHFAIVVEELNQKRISADTARRLCGMSRSTCSRRLQRYRQECEINTNQSNVER